MQSSEKLSKVTSLGLLSQLSQVKLLFQGLKKLTPEQEAKTQTQVKQIILSKITPYIEKQTLIPGLSTGLRIVLAQASDEDIAKFLIEFEDLVLSAIEEVEIVAPKLIGDAINERVLSTADLDMRDKIPTLQIGNTRVEAITFTE